MQKVIVWDNNGVRTEQECSDMADALAKVNIHQSESET